MFACVVFFFFKQKTAYEMRISDWSSDVCSSDLRRRSHGRRRRGGEDHQVTIGQPGAQAPGASQSSSPNALVGDPAVGFDGAPDLQKTIKTGLQCLCPPRYTAQLHGELPSDIRTATELTPQQTTGRAY